MRLISPHILHRYEGDLGPHPPAIKVAAVDMDVPYVRELIARYPTTPILLRFIDTAMDQLVSPGCAAAWFNRRFPTLDALRAPNVLVEFLNEVNQDRAWDYACESAPWIDMMHNAGFRVLWPSTSTGTIRKPGEPGTNVQALYTPVLARLRPRIDGCSPHEYFGNAVTTATPDHITRFRFWPELLEHDLYIGETGSDANTPGGQAGWTLTFGGDFERYLEQLRRLDALYQQWPQVKAACVYSIGETQWGWGNYALSEAQWDRIVALQEVPVMGDIPDVAAACVLASAGQLVYTLDCAGHLAIGEEEAIDVAPAYGVGELLLIAPWRHNYVEYTGYQPSNRGYHCGLADIETIYDMRQFGEMEPWPNGSFDSWLEVGLCHIQGKAQVQAQTVVDAGTVIGPMGWSGKTVPEGPGGRHLHCIVWINQSGDMTFKNWRRIDPAILRRVWAGRYGQAS